MKQLIVDFLQNKDDFTLILFNKTPIYVANSLIPLHYHLIKFLGAREFFQLKLLDYLSDRCPIINYAKDPSSVVVYVEELNDKPFVRPITSSSLGKFGYFNLSLSDLEKLISCYLPNINFTCSMTKSINIQHIFKAKISEGMIDFGYLPSDRPLFVFLKAVVTAIILSGELEGRIELEIDLKTLDGLLIEGGSSDLLKSFYPSGDLLFNLKIGLESSKILDFLPKVSKIPKDAIPFFLKASKCYI